MEEEDDRWDELLEPRGTEQHGAAARSGADRAQTPRPSTQPTALPYPLPPAVRKLQLGGMDEMIVDMIVGGDGAAGGAG